MSKYKRAFPIKRKEEFKDKCSEEYFNKYLNGKNEKLITHMFHEGIFHVDDNILEKIDSLPSLKEREASIKIMSNCLILAYREEVKIEVEKSINETKNKVKQKYKELFERLNPKQDFSEELLTS